MGVSGQRQPQALYPPGKSRYPFYRRLGGRQDRSEPLQESSPPPGFELWTVQRVADRYTNYAIRALFKKLSKSVFKVSRVNSRLTSFRKSQDHFNYDHSTTIQNA
jgi:hypothetical protein